MSRLAPRLHDSTLREKSIFGDEGDSKRFGRLEYPLDRCNKVVREGLYCGLLQPRFMFVELTGEPVPEMGGGAGSK